jgi:hypothetical protein
MPKPRVAVTVVVLALLIYAVALYFRVATASLTDSYQPGIEALRKGIWPSVVLWGPLAVALVRKSPAWMDATRAISAGALVCCVVLLLLVKLGGDAAPGRVAGEGRSLGATVRIALVQPSFSNRSVGSLIGSAAVASITCLASFALGRRARAGGQCLG